MKQENLNTSKPTIDSLEDQPRKDIAAELAKRLALEDRIATSDLTEEDAKALFTANGIERNPQVDRVDAEEAAAIKHAATLRNLRRIAFDESNVGRDFTQDELDARRKAVGL